MRSYGPGRLPRAVMRAARLTSAPVRARVLRFVRDARQAQLYAHRLRRLRMNGAGDEVFLWEYSDADGFQDPSAVSRAAQSARAADASAMVIWTRNSMKVRGWRSMRKTIDPASSSVMSAGTSAKRGVDR